MKKLLILLIFHFSLFVHSQEEALTSDNKISFAFSPGIVVQRNVFAEANLFIGKIVATDSPKVPNVGVTGFRVGIESDFNKTIAPKVGYEIAITVFALRLSAANYFQQGNSEFRLIPELGISIGGRINLTYGYGISFNNRNLTDIGHHRVCLSFNLNRKLNEANKKLLSRTLKH